MNRARHRRLGRIVLAACCAMAAVLLSSCILKPGRNLDANLSFQSPLQPVPPGPATVEYIRPILAGRSRPLKSVKAEMELVAGGGRQGSQIFNTVMYIEPASSFIRLRGSQNVGTVFDAMIRGNDVQLVLYPERRFFRGTVADLQANPALFAGVNPADLIQCFPVEQTLLAQFGWAAPRHTGTRTHQVFAFQQASGATDTFRLRNSDLLTDLFERSYGRGAVTRIRYWGYGQFGSTLLPTQFTIELPKTRGQLLVRVMSATVNEKPPAPMYRMEIPPGFENMGAR